MGDLSRDEIFRLLNPGYERSLAFRLKRVRIVHSLTQAEFAERLGISKRAYIHYEMSERSVPSEVLIRVTWEFEVNANWLLLGTEQMYQNHVLEDQLKEDVNLNETSKVNWDEATVQKFDPVAQAQFDRWQDLEIAVEHMTEKERGELKRTGKLPKNQLPKL
jgi:transcriptional regulator with XRE-family HTH domain